MSALPLFTVLALCTGANPYLDEGRKLFQELEYERAAARLSLARQVSGSSPDERRQTLDLLARCHCALGRASAAQEAYEELLALDPHTPDPAEASPKVRAAFAQAKQRLYPPPYVRIERRPAPPERMELKVIDPWGWVESVALVEEGTGGRVRHPLAVVGHETSCACLRDAVPRQWVEVAGRDGKVVAALGAPDHPIDCVAESALAGMPAEALGAQRPSPPRVRRTVPWLVAGASALAAGAGGWLVVAAAQDSRAAHAAHFTSDARALNASARSKAIAANVLIGSAILGGGVAVTWVWAD